MTGFQDIIGHEDIITQINKSIDSGMFSHAHLIVGEDGIGKSLLAKKIALKLIGRAEEKQYADISEYRVPKNRQSIGVEAVEGMIEEINKKPYEGDKKVIIIYEAEKITIPAQNTFLKTIEEPPKGVFIILLCENLEVILDTIKSRCQIHKLQRVNKDEMITFLKRKYQSLSSEEIIAISSFSDGIPGRAEKLIEDKVFKEIRDTVMDILIKIGENNDVLKYEEFLLKHKNNWPEVLNWFISYIRDALVYKETGNESLILNLDKRENVKELATMFSFNKLSDIIDIVRDTIKKLDRNVNQALVFQMMLMNIQEK